MPREESKFAARHVENGGNYKGNKEMDGESQPGDLFYWESVLTDVRDTIGRLREPVARLCRGSEEAGYWFDALATRKEGDPRCDGRAHPPRNSLAKENHPQPSKPFSPPISP